MNDTLPLQKQTILVTRPTLQAQSLTQTLIRLGAQVIAFPTIDIMPYQDKTLKQTFANTDEYAAIIFVSANAAKHSKPYWHKFTKTVLAIGPATAAALEKLGITQVTVPSTYSSEGLLELPPLQQCADKKILLVSGQPSRSLLRNTLLQRGADVSHAICYQQQLPSMNDLPSIKSLQQQNIDTIISTSQIGLSNLYQLVDPSHHDWLNQHQFLVINEKMQKNLRKLGDNKPSLLADNASDSAIIECLCKHSHKR